MLLTALAAMMGAAAPAAADSWIFRPAKYTNDPVTGARVNQFAAKEPAYVRVDPTYSESGYRHRQTIMRGADGSADRMHVVQTWGAGESIRPYGEWEFPYRAGATPYGPWGNPQGPWTLPFESWDNPYGQFNRYPSWGGGYDGGYGGGYPNDGYGARYPDGGYGGGYPGRGNGGGHQNGGYGGGHQDGGYPDGGNGGGYQGDGYQNGGYGGGHQ